MRKTKSLQRVLALSLTCGMVLPIFAQSSVSAQEGLPVTRYATPEQALESFDTDSETADKIAKKVVFGKDAAGAPLEWYIAGKDPVGGGMVLVSAAPYETEVKYNPEGNSTVDADDPSIIYENGAPESVGTNHYGASSIRAELNGEESLEAHFTSVEKDVLMESTVATTDSKNSVTYRTVDKVYFLSAGALNYPQTDKNGSLTFYAGSATKETPDGTLAYSSEYWLPFPAKFFTRSPRPTILYHVLGGGFLGAGVRQVTSLDRDTNPSNVVAVVQINTDAIDHFEADSDDAAFEIIYKGGTPGEPEPEPESFGKLIINDAGNAIDVRGVTGEVTLCVEKNGNTYRKTLTSDISYPVNLLSFDGTFIDSLDGASVYLEKDGVKEFARQREFYEYDNVLITDQEGAVVNTDDNNHVPNDPTQGPAAYAFDNDRSTFYHTEWDPEYTVSAEQPAEVTIEFNEVVNDIHQMAYLPRQDQPSGKGDFLQFSISYKVNEEDDWTLAKDVTFAEGAKSEMRFVSFDPIDAKYIRLVITSGTGFHASASEIDFFRTVDDRFTELDAAIADAENFIENAANYTQESITDIQSKLDAARTVRNKEDASNDEIGQAVSNLNNAVSLAEPTNLADLEELYNTVNAMPDDNYTSATWQALKSALSEAKAVLIGSGRTYEMVSGAIDAINTAVAGLRYNLDLAGLQTLVNECSALLEEDHETDGWAEFTEALGAAEAILDSTEQITQDQVDEAKTALQTAKDALHAKFDKNELRALIDHCDEYMFRQSSYTKEAYDNLQDAIDAAELIEADTNTTQELIDEALENLKAAEEYLLANRIPDNIKIMLREKVAELESFVSSADNEALYTDSSWNTLETVYAAAKEFSDGLELPQNPMRDLYTHYTALTDAYESLEYKPADYAKVDEAIAKADSLNKENYTDFSAVEEAVAAVDRDKNITEQTAVDAMAQAIEDAITALEYKPADYTKVDEAIAKVEGLNKEDYKDFSAVEEAIAAVVRDKNITEQSAVDAMAQAIEDAITALEKKEEPDKPGTEEPDPDKPGTEDPSQDKPGTGGTDQKEQTNENGQSNVPLTGDASNVFVWLMISLILGAGLSRGFFTRMKKR